MIFRDQLPWNPDPAGRRAAGRGCRDPQTFHVVLAALLCMLAGCSPLNAPTPTPSPAAPSATDTPAPEVADSEAAMPLSAGTPLAQQSIQLNEMLLAPIDPHSGRVIAGFDPISLGSNFYGRVTPDRRSFVYVRYPPSSSSNPEIRVLDLTTWQDEGALLFPPQGTVSASTMSEDGTRFAVAFWQPKGANVWLMDVPRRVALAHTTLPYVIASMQFTADGGALMAYARQENTQTGMSKGSPLALLLSTKRLDIEWSRELKAVVDGFTAGPDFAGDAFQPGAGSIYRPGLAFSPAGDVLFIVHADVDRLTRVDFSRKSVLTLDIKPARSWLERMLAASAGTVYAKEQSGAERQALVSADGSIVYSVGAINTLTHTGGNNWQYTRQPLPLIAVAARDASQLYASDVKGQTLEFAPDRTDLLVYEWDAETGAITATAEVEASTGKLLRLHPNLWLHASHQLDGAPLLVSATTAPGSTTFSLATLDPHGTLLAAWDSPSYADWLIVP